MDACNKRQVYLQEKNMKKLILASTSPRRKELMQQIGLAFQIGVSKTDEEPTKHSPDEIAKELSYQKAREVFERGHTEDIVIGADTVVSLDETVMGKPKDEAEAISMLESLQGKTHQVYTGVSIIWSLDGTTHVRSFLEVTKVTLYEMTKQEILAYVESGEPFDKAGGYGIQGSFAAYVKHINGDYNNVVGLPIGRLYQELKNHKLI